MGRLARPRGGDGLAPEIEKAITDAAHVVVVLSPATVNSEWVSREVAPRFITLVDILQALLAGDPQPARTDHPDLDPRDVAELRLLLASLDEPPSGTTGE